MWSLSVRHHLPARGAQLALCAGGPLLACHTPDRLRGYGRRAPVSDTNQGLGWWRRFRSLSPRAQLASWIGLAVLLIIGGVVGGVDSSGTTTTAVTAAPPTAVVATETPTTPTSTPQSLASSPSPTATATVSTSVPSSTTSTSSAPRSSTAVPAPSAAASCYPLTNSENCYAPGQYCRNTDHGKSGVAGNGRRIVCKNQNGWRWELA